MEQVVWAFVCLPAKLFTPNHVALFGFIMGSSVLEIICLTIVSICSLSPSCPQQSKVLCS